MTRIPALDDPRSYVGVCSLCPKSMQTLHTIRFKPKKYRLYDVHLINSTAVIIRPSMSVGAVSNEDAINHRCSMECLDRV